MLLKQLDKFNKKNQKFPKPEQNIKKTFCSVSKISKHTIRGYHSQEGNNLGCWKNDKTAHARLQSQGEVEAYVDYFNYVLAQHYHSSEHNSGER